MRLERIHEGIYAVVCETAEIAAKAFQRPQEHYESPNNDFAGRIFSKSAYNAWYEGDYYEDWTGFNVPDWAFKAFLSGAMHPLDEYEQKLISLVKTIKDEKFYVIGYAEGDDGTMMHEIAHGMYYLNPEYRHSVSAIALRSEFDQIKIHLVEIGYSVDQYILLDEVHAYLLAEEKYLKKHKLWNRDCHRAWKELYRLYHQFTLTEESIKESAKKIGISL